MISPKGEEHSPPGPPHSSAPTLSSSFFARKKSSTKPLSPEISSEVTCEEGQEKRLQRRRPWVRGASQPPLPTCRGGGAEGGTHCDGGLAGGLPVLEKERLAHPLLSHDLQGGAERWLGGREPSWGGGAGPTQGSLSPRPLLRASKPGPLPGGERGVLSLAVGAGICSRGGLLLPARDAPLPGASPPRGAAGCRAGRSLPRGSFAA